MGRSIILEAYGGYGYQDESDLRLSVTDSNCVLSGKILTAKAAATCLVVAKRGFTDELSNHPNNFATQTFNFIQPVDQQPLVINYTLLVGSSPGFTASHLDTFILSTSGGSGSGNVFYTLANNPYCQFMGGLTASRPTTCVVTARKAASPGYNEVLSAPTQFTFNPFSQTPFVIKYQVAGGSKAESMAIGETAYLESSFYNISGSGQKIYLSVSGEKCVINNFMYSVTASASTTCVVTATKEAYQLETRTSLGSGVLRYVTMYYSAVTSAPLSFVFDLRDQAPLSIYATPTSTKAGGIINLDAYGGSGTGAVSYNIISGAGCVYNNPNRTSHYITVAGATTCVVTGTKAASSGYRSAVTSQPLTLYFTEP